MLKRQLYLVYILALLLPICVIGSFLLYNNYSMLYEHHQSMLISDNLRVRSIIFETTTAITNVSDIIAEDKEMHNLIKNEYDSYDEARKALEKFTSIQDIYSRYTQISSITLYNNNESLHSYGDIVVMNDDLQDWFENETRQSGYFWRNYNDVNKYDVPYNELQLIQHVNIPNSSNEVVLVISISNNYLKNRIDNNDLNVDVMINDEPIFFSTWGKSNEQTEFMNYDEEVFFRFSGVEEYIGERKLLEISTLKPFKSEDSIYIFSSDPYALGRIRRLQLIAGLILAISLIIPTVMIIRYTQQLTNRVDTLRDEMHRVTDGDYNIIENFKGNDELVDLFNDLQTMIHSIKERDQQIFEGQLKEQQLIGHQKEMEMALLSSKINPHFLYNTLETIRMKAFNSDNLEVAQAIKLLGRYMRYNLESTGELTTLKSEIDYINIYLGIQKLRFSDRIDYQIEVDKNVSIDQIRVMPLLIQPIVENALLHGHEETIEDGLIWIRCIDKGPNIRIEVEDNGIGISSENLARIKARIYDSNSKDKKSIGLYNIHQRLVLFYGKSSYLDITSELGIGSKFGFIIPKDLPIGKET